MGRGRRNKNRLPPGSAPGIVYTEQEAAAEISALQFDAKNVTEFKHVKTRDIPWDPQLNLVTWVDVIGTDDPQSWKELGKKFDLHPLAMEDAVNIPQRAKLDVYDSHCFIVLQMLHPHERSTEQISLFLGKNFVITVQQRPSACLAAVRERIHKNSKLRALKADYLAYAIIDAVIDTFFPILEAIGDDIDQLEDGFVHGVQKVKTAQIHDIKSDLVYLQRLTWGHRDFLRVLLRGEPNLIQAETIVYFRDCLDHTLQQLDLIDSFRDTASGLMELVFSTANHETNQVVKILTIITSIFIPLSFIAGVYGMNFDTRSPYNMPELHWEYGYPLVLGAMLLLAILLLSFFKYRKWI